MHTQTLETTTDSRETPTKVRTTPANL